MFLDYSLQTSTDLQEDQEDLFRTKQRFEGHLPDPSTFTYGPIEDLEALDTFSVSSSIESTEASETLDEDIWAFPNSNVKAQTLFGSRNWESFYNENFQEPWRAYNSEGKHCVFDATLTGQSKYEADAEGNKIPAHVVHPRSLLRSLMQLGQGWESVSFSFSQETQSFYPLIEAEPPPGYSLEAFQNLSSSFIDQGNRTIQLRKFIQKIQASTSSPASLIALASSFSDVLARLESQWGDLSTQVHSLLQLQSRFERPSLILSSLAHVVAKIQDTVIDEEVLSTVYAFCQITENTKLWLRPMMLRIFIAASQPWLNTVSRWLKFDTNFGAKFQPQSYAPGFGKVSAESCDLEGARDLEELQHKHEPFLMPSFIAEKDAKVIFETGRSLRLLEAHQPEHPLLEPFAEHGAETPALMWEFSWENIQRVQTQAQEYEVALRIAIKDFDLQDTTRRSRRLKRESREQNETEIHNTLSEEAARAYISASISAIEEPLTKFPITKGHTLSDLSLLDTNSVPKETVAPSLLLVHTLSLYQLISAQARLANRACLRLLFKDNNLRSHLTLLHRYSLFGDGIFASRLTHALFDPELQSAERRKGYSRAGRSGLKFGSRHSWDPASSELRLALMDILTDSYHPTGLFGGDSFTFGNELPGGLSFSIREMTEEELQRYMNPDSIEALDYLRLEYKPPSPLNAVITSTSLLKYDAVFKLLLRAARILFVVNQLFRDTFARSMARPRGVNPLTQRFRIESHHFVSAIGTYFFDGVQANWAKLLARLEDVEKSLDGDGTDSLADLRNFHEAVLDQMMFALILRKGQEQVMKLIEDIFGLVLQFARHTRLQNEAFSEAQGAEDSAELKAIYDTFNKQVRVFVSVCRGLGDREEHGASGAQDTCHELSSNGEIDEDGGKTIGQLLLKLDMSGFYSG